MESLSLVDSQYNNWNKIHVGGNGKVGVAPPPLPGTGKMEPRPQGY